MATKGIIRLAAVQYYWIVEHDSIKFHGFRHGPGDVLRIYTADAAFDILLPLRTMSYYGGFQLLYAGPIIVLGTQFPTARWPVQQGARIRLRPKISKLPELTVNDCAVRRIVEWCLSAHFRPVRCDIHGHYQATLQDDYSAGVPAPAIHPEGT